MFDSRIGIPKADFINFVYDYTDGLHSIDRAYRDRADAISKAGGPDMFQKYDELRDWYAKELLVLEEAFSDAVFSSIVGKEAV